jgi:hypothetical protein
MKRSVGVEDTPGRELAVEMVLRKKGWGMTL